MLVGKLRGDSPSLRSTSDDLGADPLPLPRSTSEDLGPTPPQGQPVMTLLEVKKDIRFAQSARPPTGGL